MPGPPKDGEIPVTTGMVELTVNPLNGVDIPEGAVTVTVRSVAAAPELISMRIGRVVAVPPVSSVAVTPEPLNVTLEAFNKFSPVNVANRVPGPPVVFEIAVTAGRTEVSLDVNNGLVATPPLLFVTLKFVIPTLTGVT